MIYFESLLIAILTVLFVDTTLSDMKSGRVSNRSLAIALCSGGLCSIIYYVFFATDCLMIYAINNVIGLIVSIILYATGVWGAGDSKLLCVVLLLFPARLYCVQGKTLAASFILISIIFILSFAYVFVDTIYMGIKQGDLLSIHFKKKIVDWKKYIKGILFFYLLLSLIDTIIYKLPESLLLDDTLLITIHFIFVLLAMQLVYKINWIIIIIMGVLWLAFTILGQSHFDLSAIDWTTYIIVILLIVFRLFSDKYNYMEIPVTELKEGMILSFGSTVDFSKSRIQRLPKYSSEDLKSRLTGEEVKSIIRWSKTTSGKDKITIVRKIPFALFIGLGTVIFTILEVLSS